MDSRWCMAGMMVAIAVGAVGWGQKAETERKSRREGIRVHGHWTIEVRDPDGTVKAHQEFENSLVPYTPANGNTPASGGALALANVLTGQWSPGAFYIDLSGTTQWVIGTPTSIGCPGGFPCGADLTTVISPNGSGFTIAGDVVNSPAGTINSVSAGFTTCPGNVAPATCLTNPNSRTAEPTFTSTTLASAQQVLAGQTVAVAVQFTFQ